MWIWGAGQNWNKWIGESKLHLFLYYIKKQTKNHLTQETDFDIKI